MLGKLRPRSAYDMTVSFGARMVALAITAGLLAMAASANADTAIFSKTLAGQPTAGHPQNAALDTSGTLFEADTEGDQIIRWDSSAHATVLVPPATASSVTDPYAIVLRSGGFDVTGYGSHAIYRYDTGGHLFSKFSGPFDGSQPLPTGMAADGSNGLVVADAASFGLWRFTGGPTASLNNSEAWTQLAYDLPASPADVVFLGTDRLVVSYPALDELIMYSASSGQVLDSIGTAGSGVGQFIHPEGLTVRPNGDLLVADRGNNRIQVFPGQAAAGRNSFVDPRVLGVKGTITGPSCLVDVSAFASYRPGVGICTAPGGADGPAGRIDLFSLKPPVVPLPAVGDMAIAPHAFPAAPSGPSVKTRAGAARAYGARVTFTLNVAAQVGLTVRRVESGRKVKHGDRTRCDRRTKKNRDKPRCKRIVTLNGGFTISRAAGTNAFHFTGRLSGKRLRPGKYRLAATPSANRKTGRQALAGFEIIP